MNGTKDGDVRRYAADDSWKGPPGALFHGRPIACVIAVAALVRILAPGPQASGYKRAGLYSYEPMHHVIANRAMSDDSAELYDAGFPSVEGGVTASGAFALCEELDPEEPEAMRLPPWEAPFAAADIQCELQELEAQLASGAFLDEHHPRFNPAETDVYDQPCAEYVEAVTQKSEVEAAPHETEVDVAVLLSETAAVTPPFDEMADAAEHQVEALVLHDEVDADAPASDVQADHQESEIEAVVLRNDVEIDVPPDDAGADAKKTEIEVEAPERAIEVDGPQNEISFDSQENTVEVDARGGEGDRGGSLNDQGGSSNGAENESQDDAAEAEADDDPPRKEVPPLPVKEPLPSPAPASGDIIASVSILSENARLITVARNSSAAIDLKTDCDRAEIADPNIADIAVISPKRVIVSGKTFGTTQLILRVGQQQQVFNVSVEHDLSLLTHAIRSISATANVQPRSINGTIILTGTVPDSQTGERIAEMASLFQSGQVRNQLTVAGVQQTLLRVVVAEVNKEGVRQLGFNWAIGAADWTRDFFFANNVAGINPTVFTSNGAANIGGSPTPQLTYSVLPVGNGPGTNLTFGFPRAEFQVFMQALRQNSLARVLAEPNLVAISGQTATFLAGGEVPIPVTQGGAVAGAITIEYKEFGIRLAFTPTVLGGQIVRLHVMSEVSDAIPGTTIAGGLPVFSFLTRRVESTVECGNGQTFAMAGLLNERVRAVAQKLPGLGDVPVLGALFSSIDYQKDNTELVVLVTPQLVEPLDPQQIPPPPGSLMTEPNDYELFALGQMEGPPHETPTFEGVPRDHAPVNTPPGRGNVETPKRRNVETALRGPWGLADVDEY